MDLIAALDQTFAHAQRRHRRRPARPVRRQDAVRASGPSATCSSTWSASSPGSARPPPASRRQPFELAADPAAQFDAGRRRGAGRLAHPGVLDRSSTPGRAACPATSLAGINLLDTATHTWDLATATGQPAEPARRPSPRLRSRPAEQIVSPEIRTGRFGAEQPAPAGASPTEAARRLPRSNAVSSARPVGTRDEWPAPASSCSTPRRTSTADATGSPSSGGRCPGCAVEKDLRLRRPRRATADAARPVRRPRPAARVPLHVRPRLGRGLPELFVLGRQLRRRRRAPRPPRCHLRLRLPRAVREARRLPEAAWAGASRGSPRRRATSTPTSASRSHPTSRPTAAPTTSPTTTRPRGDAGHQRLRLRRTARCSTRTPSYSRGLDPMNGAYQLLDLAPKGRDEGGLDSPWRGCAATTPTRADRPARVPSAGRSAGREGYWFCWS